MSPLLKSLVKWLYPYFTSSTGTLPGPGVFLLLRSWRTSFTFFTLILISDEETCTWFDGSFSRLLRFSVKSLPKYSSHMVVVTGDMIFFLLFRRNDLRSFQLLILFVQPIFATYFSSYSGLWSLKHILFWFVILALAFLSSIFDVLFTLVFCQFRLAG